MMLTINDFVQALKAKYPDCSFYNGCIDKHSKCVGVYARGSAPPIKAIGTKSSYGVLPVTMLIHWGENSQECESTANKLYEGLEDGIAEINSTRVIQIQMLEACPTNIGRDDRNICEMTIRLNIMYER